MNIKVQLPEIDIFKLILNYIYNQGYVIARETETAIEIMTKEEFLDIVKELE